MTTGPHRSDLPWQTDWSVLYIISFFQCQVVFRHLHDRRFDQRVAAGIQVTCTPAQITAHPGNASGSFIWIPHLERHGIIAPQNGTPSFLAWLILPELKLSDCNLLDRNTCQSISFIMGGKGGRLNTWATGTNPSDGPVHHPFNKPRQGRWEKRQLS